MEDIYPILAKHFLGQTSIDEEMLVTEFKQENGKEYFLLKAIWNKQVISVQEFDSQKAWARFIAKREKKQTKIIPLFGNIRNIAAAVALLILGTVTTFYLKDIFPKSNIVLVENTSTSILKKQLTDGSTVWLNIGASLSYPKEFEPENRVVSLTGEAFFEVVKDDAHPFVVNSDYSTITVLGTSFNIDTNDERTKISVRTGKVEVASISSDKKKILIHNQSAIVNKNNLLTKETVNQNYLSWKTGIFEFVDTPIDQVVAQLNKYYQNSLSIDPAKAYDCNLNAKFNRAPLEEILKILEVTCDLSIQKSSNIFTIK